MKESEVYPERSEGSVERPAKRFRSFVIAMALAASAHGALLHSSDLYKLRSVGDVAISPDAKHVAYVVERNESEGRPKAQLSIVDLATNKTVALGDRSGSPLWSPDGAWLAFSGRQGEKSGLMIVRADGNGARLLAETSGTNAPVPEQGKSVAWSPDGKTIAFVSATPGPETSEANGDPVVIRRYLYKPDLVAGDTRVNDNKRLHIFLCDVASGHVKQLTNGAHNEHSIDFAPDGSEIVFASNREENEDQFFNYDLFAVKVADGAIRRITSTESAEYAPQFSPDGKQILFLATRRGLTDLETTMEDTHVWVMNADGSNRRELGTIDQRQGNAQWSKDGHVYFVIFERGSAHLMRMTPSGGERIVNDRGRVGAYSVANDGTVAYAFTTADDLAELYVLRGTVSADAQKGTPAGLPAPHRVTALNDELLKGATIAPTEAFTFKSNDFKYDVEAFLTRPPNFDPSKKYPLIVVIHGGPHGMQGPAFTFKNQVYAAHGFAVLMVNYRGSVGYGQAFADAVFGDQDGDEGQDVLYGVSAALRRNLWVDRDRLGIEGGSYGGQLTAWLITQTRQFKAAIPIAAITNFVSYNYTTYYNQYEQMEFGVMPHQGDLMDVLWQRSPLRRVAQVATPTMIVHGENDNDVPITEAEQFYIALKDVGVETIMVRYPREGHGVREPRHAIDLMDRSIGWYEGHFR
jgi:dipeptidyl aminopeptidase/acylaminoacyl peptidase